MLSFQFFQEFTVCSIFCLFLTLGEFNIWAIEGQRRMNLGRDLTYDGVTSINTRYVVRALQGINFSTCVRHCLLRSPECAALLYSKTLFNCTLLKCHLNDRLTKDSPKGDDWEYWKNDQGKLFFFKKKKKKYMITC
jgi:hypothetical protein